MAFRDAATQNLDALNNFSLANIQRATQLQTAQMAASTQLQVTSMNNQMQWAVSQLQAATQINIANLDSRTQLRVTEMNGQIQAALANLNYKYNRNLQYQEHLNNMSRDYAQHGYNLETTALAGEYDLAAQQASASQSREMNYITSVQGAYQGTIQMIQALNGLEMDAAARQNAIDEIWASYYNQLDLLNALYGYTPGTSPVGGGEGDGG
jgi:hypothetical protein